MKKAAVTYLSRYGFTKQYADWISQALSCDEIDFSKNKKPDLSSYDVVIHGGGIYAGSVSGLKELKTALSGAQGKALTVFTVGSAPPEETDYTPLIDKNFPGAKEKSIRFFHLRGGIDFDAMKGVHKMMMAMMRKMMAKQKELCEEEKRVLGFYGGRVDFCDEAAVSPLVEYVKELLNT